LKLATRSDYRGSSFSTTLGKGATPMRRRNLTALVVMLVGGCHAGAPQAADPPVRADFLERREGKPPSKFHFVRLTLVNSQNKAVWFVLPYWGDRPLSQTGLFTNDKVGQPFGGFAFAGEGGSAVRVQMYGGEGFKAFRLPAKGRLELDDYSIDASKYIDEIEVMETRELKVNGKTPLEKWLPYATTCDEKVMVRPLGILATWTDLDWDATKRGKRDDYPKEKVENVKAEGFRFWTVKFQQKPEK